ncbi:MAG TPA: rhomboid family intramembrane serine protease [Acidobacteriaceae bacterium]|jgi:rhomboid protease GluP
MANRFSWGAEDAAGVDRAPQRPRDVSTTTYVLIAINVLVFVAMVARGVSFMQPTVRDVIPWGADFGPLTIGAGQWWRMLTSCFVHFGVIHIGFNMFVLFQIGPFIESLFGRARYLMIYLFAGLAGSLVSLWVHPLTTSAGASGAIFGLYGAVFGFLLMERRSLAPGATRSIAQSAGIFILYNFIYGAGHGQTDMAAHIGGLVGGFLAGLLLVRRRADGPWRVPVAATAVVLAGILGAGIGAIAQRPGNRSAANGLLAILITSPSLPFGNGGKLVYSGGVTDADAKNLVSALDGTELGKVKDMLVLVSRDNGRTTVSVPLGGDADADEVPDDRSASPEEKTAPWNNPEVVQAFTAVGHQLQPALGGASFDMVILNSNGEPRRTIAIAGR